MNKNNTQGSISSSIMNNLFWKISERFGAQIVSLIVVVVLARILTPEDFGLIALVTIFITIAEVFVNSGFGNALIQKKSVDSLDYSSVFFFNMIMSVFLYVLIFFSAPYIANFYGYELLSIAIRIVSLRLFLSAVNTVQHSYVARNMMFKNFFYSTLTGTIISAFVGISMALLGYGLWALVAQYIINALVNTIILWFTIKWRPSLVFSFKRISELFSFGWKLLASGLLDTLNTQLRQLIIGKIYSADDLAFYNRGMQFPSIIMININTSIGSVVFPMQSKLQDDLIQLKNLTRKSISVSSYFVFPMMVGLGVIAESLISFLLTDKWLLAVPYLRIFSFTYAVTIMQIGIQGAILARRRSDVFLKMDIISKFLSILLVILVLNKGAYIIALTSIITAIFNVIMKAIVSKHIFNYHFKEHLSDNLPTVCAAAIMGLLIYFINYFGFSSLITMLLQITSGIIIYVILSLIMKLEGFYFSIYFIKKTRKEIMNV